MIAHQERHPGFVPAHDVPTTQRFMRTFALAFILPVLLTTELVAQPESRLPPGVIVHRDLDYVGDGHPRHRLDLYLPAEGTRTSPRPLVIWIHGGGWRGGNKDNPPALFLLNDGFAVASIHYRLSQQATFPAQAFDCKAAIRWLRAHAEEYRLDPERFGAWGSSAGGHLAALMGTSGDFEPLEGNLGTTGVSSRIQAVCDYYGPTDLVNMADYSNEYSTRDYGGPNSAEGQLLGGSPRSRPRAARAASPLEHVSADDPPFLIVHGDRDPVLPIGHSEALHRALTDVGVESRLMVIAGGGHGPFRDQETLTHVREFFQRHLQSERRRDSGRNRP